MSIKKGNRFLHKNYRIFFETALIIVLTLFIVAMNLELRGKKANIDFSNVEEIVHIKEIQRTIQKPKKPLVLPPDIIIEVPDNKIITDPIKNIDLDNWQRNKKIMQSKLTQTDTQGSKETIFVSVQKMPKLLNKKEFYRGIEYPEKCESLGIEGTVYVRFIVTKTGVIKNAKVLQGIGGGCDEYALNYIINHADFSIGRQRGVPVSVKFTIPITFNIK